MHWLEWGLESRFGGEKKFEKFFQKSPSWRSAEAL
jgi:hypothetical protein